MLRRKLLLSTLSLFLLFSLACNNKPSDDAVTTSIKAKLYSEPLLKAASINVVAKDGIVTLTGQVPDDAARLAAQHIASTTPGVKTVVDQTTMAPPPPATTAENFTPPAPPARPARPARTPRKPAPPAPIATPAPVPAPAQDSAPSPGPLHDPAPEKPSAPAPPPPPPPPQPITVTVPEGTILTVRTIDSIDSSVNRTGQTFRASLDAPIVVGDRVVISKGLNVNLKLVDTSSAGKFKGRSELTVSLDSFTYQGRTYQIASSDVQEKGGSRGKRSAEVIGGGAVLGAIIGGLDTRRESEDRVRNSPRLHPPRSRQRNLFPQEIFQRKPARTAAAAIRSRCGRTAISATKLRPTTPTIRFALSHQRSSPCPEANPRGFFECGNEAPAFTHLTPPPVPSTSAPTPKFVILSPRLMRAKDLN